jgi:hypothetical protein
MAKVQVGPARIETRLHPQGLAGFVGALQFRSKLVRNVKVDARPRDLFVLFIRGRSSDIGWAHRRPPYREERRRVPGK